MNPDPKIVGLYQHRLLGDPHGIVKPEAVVQAESPPASGGPSVVQRRKAKAARHHGEPCPFEKSVSCQHRHDFKDPKGCCRRVERRECAPPVAIRLLFRVGHRGVIAPIHLDIAAGKFVDAKGTD